MTSEGGTQATVSCEGNSALAYLKIEIMPVFVSFGIGFVPPVIFGIGSVILLISGIFARLRS